MNRPFLGALLGLLVALGGGALYLGWASANRRSTPADARPAPEIEAQPSRLVGRGPEDGVHTDPRRATPAPRDHAEGETVTLHGTVQLRGEGTPASGGVVEVQWTRAGERDDTEEHTSQGPLDAEGRYAVGMPRGVTLGAAQIRPGPFSGARAGSNFVETEVELPAERLDGDRLLDLEAEPGLVVAGEVVEAAGGRPVSGAAVVHRSRSNPSDARAGTLADEHGRFRLSGLSLLWLLYDEEIVLEARAEGFQSGAARRPVPDDASDVEGVRITLARGVTFAGRLRAPEGTPLEGATVRAWAALPPDVGLGRRIRHLGETVLETDGSFRALDFAPGARARVEVASRNEWAPGIGLGAGREDVDLTHDQQDLVLETGPSVIVAVAATFPDGVRVAAEDMTLTFRDDAGVVRTSSTTGKNVRFLWAAPGRRVDVRVYGRRTPRGGPQEAFQGAVGVLAPVLPAAGFPTEPPVVVPLVPLEPPSLPPAWEGVPSNSMNAPWECCRVFLVRFVDAADGAPVGDRALELALDGGSARGHLAPDGRRILAFGLGRSFLRVRVEGYEHEDLLLDIEEPGVEETTVRLRRLL